MADVNLKTDFKDGEKLFGQQLNNNFNVIKAALNTVNKIVWQDDPTDSVTAFRGTTAQINSRDVIDGQILYNTETGETYIDYGSQRISTGSGNAIHIGDDQPTNPATLLWVNPDEPMQALGSEVVNSISGNETDMAPSVMAAKNYFNNAIATYGIVENSLSFTTTETYQNWKIPLNSRKCGANDEDKFTLDTTNNKITIGEGVKKIKISGSFSVNRGDGTYLNIYIMQNKGEGNNVVARASSYFDDWALSSPTICSQVIDVEEGDTIELWIGTGVGETGKTFQFAYPDLTIILTLEEINETNTPVNPSLGGGS